MESTRQNKIERLVQKELSDMFVAMTKTYHGTLVSVTSVKVSSDLSIARIRVSIFPQNKVDETLELLKNSTKSIRFELGKRVHNQLRIIPELTFFIDDSMDYLENIDRLLAKDKEKTGNSSEAATDNAVSDEK